MPLFTKETTVIIYGQNREKPTVPTSFMVLRTPSLERYSEMN